MPRKHIRNKSYCGYVNDLPYDDDRIPEFKRQYKERGFDDTETWTLYHSITKFILPRLKRFREIECGFPACFDTREEWNIILNKMIFAFDSIDNGTEIENEKRVSEGLDLFRKWFFSLWW